MRGINVALAQIDCEVGDKESNVEKMKAIVKEATKRGAQLVIFPELSTTGYVIRDLVYELAELVPGPSTSLMEEEAKGCRAYVIFGIPERSERVEGVIYNTAVLLGPDGYIGKYRKLYLPTHGVFEEKRYFRPGGDVSVFDTPLGRLGLMICYDIFFPEVSRLMRLRGAQLIVCISASPAGRREFFEVLTAARAIENNAFLAYVNLVGIEDGLEFWGGSRLINPIGGLVVKAKYDEEDLLIGQVDYADLERASIAVPTVRDLRADLLRRLSEASEVL